MKQKRNKLAGAPGFEPGDGGIKIRDQDAVSICSDATTPHNPPTLCPDSCPAWPARATIKRTFRALERWIEDRKGELSTDELKIARAALLAVQQFDQPRAETMAPLVRDARIDLLKFIETFKGRRIEPSSISIVPEAAAAAIVSVLTSVLDATS